MGLGVTLTNLFYFFKISLQILYLTIRAWCSHRRAKAVFKKTLILSGVPKEVVREIVEAYPNPIKEILSLINVRRISKK